MLYQTVRPIGFFVRAPVSVPLPLPPNPACSTEFSESLPDGSPSLQPVSDALLGLEVF
jgi:hypothetical protein